MPDEMIKGAVGSAYYVAPEVLQGEYTELCDMWSLGVITYMLVSGSPPFWGKDDRGIRAHIISGKYRFPSKAFDKISDQVHTGSVGGFHRHSPSHTPDWQ